MNNKRKFIIIICGLLFILLYTYLMHLDNYLSGDEVITYGMANSYYQGWMYSSGRVCAYFKEHIIANTLVGTVSNFVYFVKDILTNMFNAQYFSYPKPSETGWYSGIQVSQWFSVEPLEQFTYDSVYFNAMGDDANPFLYYAMVHTIGSLFPAISASKYSAFIVNIIGFLLCNLVLLKYCKILKFKLDSTLIVLLLFGLSGVMLGQITYLRAYVWTTFYHLLLIFLHIRLYFYLLNGEIKKFTQFCIALLCIYPVSYLTHYSNLFIALLLGLISTIIISLSSNNLKYQFLRKYLLFGIIAIALGFILDPTSVMGLLMKFMSKGGSEFVNYGAIITDSLNRYLTVNNLGIILLVVVYAIGIVKLFKDKQKSETDIIILCLFGLSVIYILILCIFTKQDYFKPIYPLLIITFVYLINQIIGSVIAQNNTIRIRFLYVFFIVVFGLFSFNNELNVLNVEGQEINQVKEVLETQNYEYLIYLRGKEALFDFAPLMQNSKDNLVITLSNQDWTGFEKDILTKSNDYIVVACCEQEYILEFEEWIKDLGFSNMEILKTENYDVMKIFLDN